LLFDDYKHCADGREHSKKPRVLHCSKRATQHEARARECRHRLSIRFATCYFSSYFIFIFSSLFSHVRLFSVTRDGALHEYSCSRKNRRQTFFSLDIR
jgi:hypothetical protein